MNYAAALKKSLEHTAVEDENIPATRVEQRGAEKEGGPSRVVCVKKLFTHATNTSYAYNKPKLHA